MPLPFAAFALLGVRQEPSVDAIRAVAAKAIGAARVTGTWKLQGLAKEASLWQRFELLADGGFRYRRGAYGLLPLDEGFDGKAAWTLGFSGVPHVIARGDREISRLTEAVIDGGWAFPDAPLRFRRLPDEGGAPVLEMKVEGGIVAATLRLDSKTYLPTSLSYWGAEGTDVWSFADYHTFNGLTVASRIEHKGGDENESIVVESAERVQGEASAFAEPTIDENRATYDRTAAKEIEVKRIAGYLFVRPLIDGVDEGWWFLDTGADVMVIDKAVALRRHETEIGSQATAGVVGAEELPVCQGASFRLGPLTLHRPTYAEMDVAPIAKVFGIPIAGICGYDFISRVALDIDPTSDRIVVDEPGGAHLPAGTAWTPFAFNGNAPNIRCTFEGDHTGYFTLDTGSGSLVDFLTPAVAKYDLLTNRKVTTSGMSGVGGSAESREGKIAWFELGGRRFENVSAGFQLTKRGVFASPYFDGNVGIGLLGKRRLILDYRNSRLAFGNP